MNLDPIAAAWLLAAWWWAIAIAMGSLVSMWLWILTGGEWGDALRAPWLALGRWVPVLALLGLLIAFTMHDLFPWARDDDWTTGIPMPAFKAWWLTPAYVGARAVLILVVWAALALLTVRPANERSPGFAAAALMLWALTTSVATIDWLMSLMPRWSSAGFPLVVLAMQGLAGLAAAVVLRRGPASAKVLRDLGNLLMAWLLFWAYLEFVQFQVIWAGDLPREIAWYRPRVEGAWSVLGLLLAAGFALPMGLLLFRGVKQDPRRLRAIAMGLLLLHAVETVWLILPGVTPQPPAPERADAR